MNKLSILRTTCLACVFCAAAAIGSPAQTFKTLHSFDFTDGSNPWAALVQATNGNLYGTTVGGGANGDGTVFELTPGGKLTTLYSFCAEAGCTDGYYPVAALVQATDGNLYGTTQYGGVSDNCYYVGPSGCGTVFKITPSGTLTTLHTFEGYPTDGANPFGALVQATNGNFYGTTQSGGAYGYGTVFEITPGGRLTTLYSFCSQSGCTDGEVPFAGLAQATDGNFYGTTWGGGANGGGTAFKMTSGGTLTTLYNFFCSQCTDGSPDYAALVQATDGNFYSTTIYGGANGEGTVFRITPSGTLTTLQSFDGTDGANPYAGLVQGTNGNFYGTTTYGGAYCASSPTGLCGTVFEITPERKLITLYSFCAQTGCADGAGPYDAPVQATNGTFYGTTWAGGTGGCVGGCGTVFSLTVGLGPFVETLPTSGKVGTKVTILGNNLTGATSVTFNGAPANFTARSTEITTTVPSGATTGYVKVTTPSGALTSNVKFRVP